MNILITGGAGFIGTHLSRKLVSQGHEVTIFDNFAPQIHGTTRELAPDLASNVILVAGDVRDKDAFHSALSKTQCVVHFAAETGTGQSMYDVINYDNVNIKGTSILMDFIINNKKSNIEKVLVASSRAIYGEGKYHCAEHNVVYPGTRAAGDMKRRIFEPLCPVCGRECEMRPTDESTPFSPSSMYGLTKQVQEQMCLLYGRSLDIPAYAFRYQNVYGPGQSLKNPYTGILAIFSTLARQGKTIRIFEDGEESRDFVHVDDVATITAAAIQADHAGVEAVNVGSGVATTVMDVAQGVVDVLGTDTPIEVTGEFRVGDIRHNVADLAKARTLFGFEPAWSFEDGLRDFLQWTLREEVGDIGYEASLERLKSAGLHFQS